MGVSCMPHCHTNYDKVAVPPNPSPFHWKLVDKAESVKGYVLKVMYLGCTNFEGMKIMVFRGKYEPRFCLDPHFSEYDTSPVARFRPDAEGWKLALELLERL